ncbi:MAG: SdpI family protein [Oscillospiraceae bacterium]|nr:SdpI family protein [Oscillospiraceae bacterium]
MEKENKIIELLDAIIPKLDLLLSDMRFWMSVAVLIGPILFAAMGAFYYFAAPKEANHRVGYRTYFGMGSVAAWRFTQKIAGMVWGGVGAVLTLVAVIVCIVLGGKEPAEAMSAALTMLIIEAVCALLAFLTVEITVFIRYDMNGNLKNKKR